MRKEKRDNMKKLLSTIAILLLFISAIGITFNLRPTKADTEYITMTVAYDPLGMSPAPVLIPTAEPHVYPKGSQISISAPLEVVGDSVKYVFLNWMTVRTNDSYFIGNNTLDSFLTMTQDDNYTYTACYKIQYLFTVTTLYDTAYIWDGSGWQTNGTNPLQVSLFIDAGTTVKAGVSNGLVNIPPGDWGQAIFQNWLGDVSGTGDGTTNPQHSNPVNLTRPMSAATNWTVQYYLWTDPNSVYLPVPDGHAYDPDKRGYYLSGTDVQLTAPAIDPNISPLQYRWRFDHWIVQKWNGTAWDPKTFTTQTITIHMVQPAIATIYFWLQYYVTVTDDITGISGVGSQSDYYDVGSTQFFTAPENVTISADSRWLFAYWKDNVVYYSPNKTISFVVPFWPLHTLTAVYYLQYLVKLAISPSLANVKVEMTDGTKDIIGNAAIADWFTLGSTVVFYVPDTAEQDDNHYKWVFDTRAGKQWWMNQVWYGTGWFNGTGWLVQYGPLNQAINMSANYCKWYYIEWDTLPLSNMGGQKSSGWFHAGSSVPIGFLTSISPNWVFKQSWDSAGGGTSVSQGIGVNPFTFDGGSLSTWHSVEAEYWNVTTLYIAPFTITKTAPAACGYFDVYVYAANFLLERQKDLKAIDFHIYYNSTLIKLAAVEYEPELNALWGTNNWFPAKNESFTAFGWDYYWFVATAINGAANFDGSKPVVKLTFHIEVDPCYPTVYSTPIGFVNGYALPLLYPPQVTNSTGQQIMTPEYIYPPAQYQISAPQPIVKMTPDLITIRKNVPTSFFDVFVNIELGLNIEDFYIVIDYPNTYIEPLNVTFGTYLPGPGFITRGFSFNKGIGRIYVYASEDSTSPLGNGNGTLFSIKFKVKNQVFWNNPALIGTIKFYNPLSHLSQISTLEGHVIQTFNPMVITQDATYKYDPKPGDVNFDGVIDVLDLIKVASKYGLTVGAGQPYDLNLNGKVDLIDLVLVALNFGT